MEVTCTCHSSHPAASSSYKLLHAIETGLRARLKGHLGVKFDFTFINSLDKFIFMDCSFVFKLKVVMCKFHSVFLSADGRVFTCGHGRGGRLGHGNEETLLVN